MEPNMVEVKSKRRYDATRRRAQAAQTRTTILDAARRLFLEDGYAATTVPRVAAFRNSNSAASTGLNDIACFVAVRCNQTFDIGCRKAHS